MKQRNGFTAVELIVGLAVVGIIAAAVYVYLNRESRASTQTTITSTSNSSTDYLGTVGEQDGQSPSVTTAQGSPSTIKSANFQEYLATECQTTISDGYEDSMISLDKLPVIIDYNVLRLANSNQKSTTCISASAGAEKDLHLLISLKSDGDIYANNLVIYDSLSQELGHGNFPNTGIYGDKIYQSGNVSVYMYPTVPASGEIDPEFIDVRLRGVKTFTLASGALFQVNLELTGTPSRGLLTEALSPLMYYDTVYMKEMIREDRAEEIAPMMKEKFFSEPTTAVNELLRRLDALTLR